MPSFKLETAHGRRDGVLIAGIDEVGRGPLAGPVVAAAVIWPLKTSRACHKLWREIDDSKKLTAAKRAELAACIREHALFAIGEASVAEIDAINILQASWLAMQRAVDQLAPPALCLVDGNYTSKNFTLAVRTVVGGDGLSLSIAAASIIAKVYRDALMAELADMHPEYGWHSNVGYSTARHLQALRTHGPTPHHRQSFAPVRACLESEAA